MKKVEDIRNDALALNAEQKEAFRELARAILRCKELGMAVIRTDTDAFMVNDEHIYDVMPIYDDWTVEKDIDLRNQERLPFIMYYHVPDRCSASVSVAFDQETASEIYMAANNIK